MQKIGVVTAFLMIRRAGLPATLNLLWALEGANDDIDWRMISKSRKDELKRALNRAGPSRQF